MMNRRLCRSSLAAPIIALVIAIEAGSLTGFEVCPEPERAADSTTRDPAPGLREQVREP